MTHAVRLSPSGPVLANDDGGPFQPGAGARLRLAESTIVMGGSQAVPAEPDVISPDGFGDPDALVLTLASPKEALNYRASLVLDVINTSTNANGEVVLYLDVSTDGGSTYVNRAKNVHVVGADVAQHFARQVQLNLSMLSGADLGVDDSTPTATIKLRARANAPVGTLLFVSSLPTSGGGSPVSGLDGTIHMQLEECF